MSDRRNNFSFTSNPLSTKCVTPVEAIACYPSTIQPFEILQVDLDDASQLLGLQRIPTDEAHCISATSNALVSNSTLDGHRITHEETHAAVKSTSLGLNISEETDRKVLLANYDTPSFAPPVNASSPYPDPYHNASAPVLSAHHTASSRGSGYVIPEYKSIYDDPGIAQANTTYEYKSIYDP